MLRKLTFLTVSAVITFGTLSFDLPQKSEDPGDRLVGIWEPSNGRSRIKIDRIGNKYYGRVVWLIEPNDADGNPRTDINNPDPDLRNVPLRGFRMCKDFVYQGDDQWSEGTCMIRTMAQPIKVQSRCAMKIHLICAVTLA